MRSELLALAASLSARDERFALVTVVRREPPALARIGEALGYRVESGPGGTIKGAHVLIAMMGDDDTKSCIRYSCASRPMWA
jgi:hypothetical protein